MGNQPGISPGDTALDVVEKLARSFGNVRTFFMTSYSPSPGLEERLAATHPSLHALFARASALRAEVGMALPYWQSILASVQGPDEATEITNECLRHSVESSPRMPFEPSQLNTLNLMALSATLGDGVSLALCSIVETLDGSSMYLPMMDFRLPVSASNLRWICHAMSTIGCPGAVLRSGKSYHFYGFTLLTHASWLGFVGRCILLSPITDTRYIGHRLIEGSLDLRVGTTAAKELLPVVEAIIG